MQKKVEKKQNLALVYAVIYHAKTTHTGTISFLMSSSVWLKF